MTEYKMLDVIGQHTDTMISLLQWWVGITLGILVSVHVIGKDLNGYITSLLIAVYISFTGVISVMASAHRYRQQLLVDDLGQLLDRDVPVGKMVQATVETGGPPQYLAILGMIGF